MNAKNSLLFPPTSRYYGTETATCKTVDGKEIVYLTRRFVPAPERFALLQEHLVVAGDRLDNITALYLNDPLQRRFFKFNFSKGEPEKTQEAQRHQSDKNECDSQSPQWSRYIRILHLFPYSGKRHDG